MAQISLKQRHAKVRFEGVHQQEQGLVFSTQLASRRRRAVWQLWSVPYVHNSSRGSDE